MRTCVSGELMRASVSGKLMRRPLGVGLSVALLAVAATCRRPAKAPLGDAALRHESPCQQLQTPSPSARSKEERDSSPLLPRPVLGGEGAEAISLDRASRCIRDCVPRKLVPRVAFPAPHYDSADSSPPTPPSTPLARPSYAGFYAEYGAISQRNDAGSQHADAGAATQNIQLVRIKRVIPAGPAEAAGLEVGDVLLTFGDWAVEDVKELAAWIAESIPHKPVRVRIWRAGRILRVSLVPLPAPGVQQIP